MDQRKNRNRRPPSSPLVHHPQRAPLDQVRSLQR
jgi:hypothetical protein